MKYKLLLLILMGFVIKINAQEEKEVLKLTMQEAISYAIKNNYENSKASNDIKAARKRKWETTTMGLPQISGKLDYQNWLKQRVSVFPASFSDPFSQLRYLDKFYNLEGLKKTELPPAPTQGAAIPIGAKQTLDASVTLSQLIFDGSYIVGLQSAKTYMKISEQAKEKTELVTKEAVINAYGNVLVAQESVKVLEKNKKILTRNVEETQKIYDNGLTELENVEQLQITLGTLESGLRNAKRMEKIAYQMLNIVLGNSVDEPLELTDSLSQITQNNTDLSLLSDVFDFKNHIDYQMTENNRESKRLLMRLEQSKALPTLAAYINYGANANADKKFTFFNKEQQWFDYSLFGVSLKVPIFSSLGRSSKVARARINLETADLQMQEVVKKLTLQAESAKSEYQLSIENLETAKKNLDLAEKIEKKQQVKFFEGISSSFDLSRAKNQLYTQQNNYIQAMVNVINKKAKLETALNKPIN